MSFLFLLAPFFLVFEALQLAMAERYLGIKHIARGGDPREMGPSEGVSFLWFTGIVSYGVWMLSLLFVPAGRVHGLSLLGVSLVGGLIRRNCPLKWILVVLTFEGALRVGFLFSLCQIAWRILA